MAGETVGAVYAEWGGVRVVIHPTGAVRVSGSHQVHVRPGATGSGHEHDELLALVSTLPDRMVVELRRSLGPWFDKYPAMTARLDPDLGRGAHIVVSVDGGDRRGAGELGSVPVLERPQSKLKPQPRGRSKTKAGKQVQPKKAKASKR